MARQKRVLVVSAAEHDRIVTKLKLEIAAWKAAAQACRSDIDGLQNDVESLMADTRRALRSRTKLYRNRACVQAACGRAGCRTLLTRPFHAIGGIHRRCGKCAAEERDAFVAARAAILESPASPTMFLST